MRLQFNSDTELDRWVDEVINIQTDSRVTALQSIISKIMNNIEYIVLGGVILTLLTMTIILFIRELL